MTCEVMLAEAKVACYVFIKRYPSLPSNFYLSKDLALHEVKGTNIRLR